MRTIRMNDEPPISVTQVCAFIFAIATLAGLTRELRKEIMPKARIVIATMLLTGMYALGSSLVLYKYFEGNIEMLVGMAILTGIGTQTSAEFVWSIAKTVISSKVPKI